MSLDFSSYIKHTLKLSDYNFVLVFTMINKCIHIKLLLLIEILQNKCNESCYTYEQILIREL